MGPFFTDQRGHHEPRRVSGDDSHSDGRRRKNSQERVPHGPSLFHPQQNRDILSHSWRRPSAEEAKARTPLTEDEERALFLKAQKELEARLAALPLDSEHSWANDIDDEQIDYTIDPFNDSTLVGGKLPSAPPPTGQQLSSAPPPISQKPPSDPPPTIQQLPLGPSTTVTQALPEPLTAEKHTSSPAPSKTVEAGMGEGRESGGWGSASRDVSGGWRSASRDVMPTSTLRNPRTTSALKGQIEYITQQVRVKLTEEMEEMVVPIRLPKRP